MGSASSNSDATGTINASYGNIGSGDSIIPWLIGGAVAIALIWAFVKKGGK